MKTLNYVKVAVFALIIGVTLYTLTHLSLVCAKSNFNGIKQKPSISKVDEYWLAMNIYHEAASESRIGKVAVGIVTLNRVKDPRYPKTVKDVITDRNQFSWYGKKSIIMPKDSKMWRECLMISKMLLTKGADDDIMSILEGATHYHAVYVKPSWAKTKRKIVQIGDHIFYKI